MLITLMVSKHRSPINTISILKQVRLTQSYSNPPASLLKKRKIRLQNYNGGGIDDSNNTPKDLIMTSLRDVWSLFQPNSMNQEDDDIIEKEKYLKLIFEKVESNHLLKLFKLSSSTASIPTDLLESKFENISQIDKDVIELAISKEATIGWNQWPIYLKQLDYYLKFGSYGPRSNIQFENAAPFVNSVSSPSSSLTSFSGKKVRKLNDAYIDLYANDQGSKFYDPLTTSVLILSSILFIIGYMKNNAPNDRNDEEAERN
ncbi:Gep7p NDAI_0I01640 [Naumovozyma dairenensis CBS 421]|uniref:Genetic interactor of prohibitin 7, mitochondrial n=1 Tax=Naumovozyma dairenensis (strain ATCC 10597 / BCRC 20456 / CBS 421 / NBRC 0211 / NRRL Y-12639) TaxID=1071378 RepID=G0WG22_NAUDC|nr:hypothetical protein NDAI_0I01640 [Naumovozyma dairenensis CBS 421]CCD26733.1 hypothetical protein NDAI_0I01640 [Naumovozyma dairenensis CBS 421]